MSDPTKSPVNEAGEFKHNWRSIPFTKDERDHLIFVLGFVAGALQERERRGELSAIEDAMRDTCHNIAHKFIDNAGK